MSKLKVMDKKRNVLKEIDQIADSIKPMREQPDGIGNSRAVATQSVFIQAKELLANQQNEGMDERFNKLVLTKLYEMLRDLIPIAEHQYRKWPGDRFAAMSLSNYVKQMQDIMKDIRSIQDFSAQQERLTKHNSKIFHNMLQVFSDELFKVKKVVHEQTDISRYDIVDRAMMQMIQNYGLYMQESLKAINSKIEEQLS